jgi:arylsulfatase A-like enzyme
VHHNTVIGQRLLQRFPNRRLSPRDRNDTRSVSRWALHDLGVANDTIVIYTTDNGPNQFSWPDAATTPFRSEKDTNWEGAFRVPAMIRWPGHIRPGEVSNEIVSGLDWFPTLLASAGDTTVKGGYCGDEPPHRRSNF